MSKVKKFFNKTILNFCIAAFAISFIARSFEFYNATQHSVLSICEIWMLGLGFIFSVIGVQLRD